MVHLYPGVWSGFGEIHFKKQEFSEELAGRPTEPYGPSIDAIFDVIGEMRAFAVVHCDEDTPHNLGLLRDPPPTRSSTASCRRLSTWKRSMPL